MSIDIDEAKVKRNEFGLWIAWTLATTLGMLVGYLSHRRVSRVLGFLSAGHQKVMSM